MSIGLQDRSTICAARPATMSNAPPRPGSPMARNTPDRRVWLLIAAMACTAAGLWKFAAPMDQLPGHMTINWLALLVLAAVAERLSITIEVRGDSYNNNFGPLALALGLVLADPATLVITRVVAYAIVFLMTRRFVPTKLVFNLVGRCLETGIAVVVFRSLIGDAAPTGPRASAAMLLAIVAADAVNTATINAAVAITVGHFRFSPWQTTVAGSFAIAESSLALLTLIVLFQDWRSLWLIAVLTVGIWAIYGAFVRVRSRYASLELLYRFTDSLAGSTDTEDVTARTLVLARELLRAGHAELIIPISDGLIVHRLDDDDQLLSEATRPITSTTIQSALVGSKAAVLMSQTGAHALRDLATFHGWNDLVAAPLSTDGSVGGVLVVANRLADVSTFDAEDLKLLQTFARNTSIALHVGELVDELRREAAEKEFRAEHDSLTGLGNRSLLTHRLEAMLPAATEDHQVALFFMDLDGFKEVNDALGHHTGDVLLVEVARRLQHVVGRRGVVARLGGDEFAVLLSDITHESAAEIAKQVRSAIEEHVELDQLNLEVHVSIGIAFAPHDADEARTLFQRADVAMYVAKEQRTGIELYDERYDHSGTRRLTIASELRHALETGGLRLHYQPQANLHTGGINGVEALARWPHPAYGGVPPDEFIPIAEQSGLIHTLTRWALDTALADLVHWRERWPHLTVSVNMSARNLLDAALADDVEDALRQAGLPASALTLELTESSVMADPQRSLTVLNRLHALGVHLAIDDFGTGYSSLAYLKRLPVDELKIDKSFVAHMTTDADDTMIVRSTIDLAHNLGLSTVAEGVEDDQTWDLVARLGCDSIQGYHLARPMPAAEMSAWLSKRLAPPTELLIARPEDTMPHEFTAAEARLAG